MTSERMTRFHATACSRASSPFPSPTDASLCSHVLWATFAVHLAPPNWATTHHHPRGRRGTRRPIDASGQPSKPSSTSFTSMNFCWRTLTTFMPWSRPPEFAKSMISWPTNSIGTRRSNSTVAKPACGMLQAPLPIWHLWATMCGSATKPCPWEFTILGTPLGSEIYVRHQLNNINCSHEQLLQRIPARDDLQAFWLLLLFCASPRSNYILRTTAPAFTTEFAADHDVAVTSCLRQLLGQPPLTATALGRAHLPLALGGGLGLLGLQSATVLAPAAYWASTIHSSNVSILRRLSLSPAFNPNRARGSRHTAGCRLEPSKLARLSQWRLVTPYR